jgi:hypothetical protein
VRPASCPSWTALIPALHLGEANVIEGVRRVAGNSGQPGRTVTSKIVSILCAFPVGRAFTLSELARQTNLPVSTVHRLVSELARAQALERDAGLKYRPSPGLRNLIGEHVNPFCRRCSYGIDSCNDRGPRIRGTGVCSGRDVGEADLHEPTVAHARELDQVHLADHRASRAVCSNPARPRLPISFGRVCGSTLGRRTASGCACQRHAWTTRSRTRTMPDGGRLLVTNRGRRAARRLGANRRTPCCASRKCRPTGNGSCGPDKQGARLTTCASYPPVGSKAGLRSTRNSPSTGSARPSAFCGTPHDRPHRHGDRRTSL